MKKKQKDNLIKAFEELNAPDKDGLLQKIESKKALGGRLEQQKAEEKQRAARRNRTAWASFACCLAVITIAVILISISIFRSPTAPDAGNGGSNVGADVIDYRSSWNFKSDDNISFDETDKNIKNAEIDLIYDYSDEWTIVKTQVTQDESAYREYYVKDGVKVEVTLFLEENVTSMDGRYYAILMSGFDSFLYGNYRVYHSSYTVNGARKHAYTIYLKEQVYVFTSDVDLKYLFN
ncbi:MAG: hypothetical protein K2M75_04395 [Clostridia bacterium]|nr:hypothetical protein [Clostridia bacterium]